jgi:5-hydroxyisourate hydrolase-like protein (transthyretin family)
LRAATYFLATTFNNQGLRNEIYDNIPCIVFCSTANALATGAPVPVSAGAAITGRNFALETGGSISGVITNAATGQPLPNVSVSASTRLSTGVVSTSSFTNANGEYTIAGLAAATYSVSTGSSTTTNEIYPDLLCLNFCSLTTAADSGGAVAVTLGATTSGINLALDPGLSVSGTITNETTGLPLQNVTVTAFLRVVQGFSGRSGFTDASGNYTIQGLVAGTYVLATSTSSFVNEIYDNIPCTGSCSTTALLATGTPVSVTSGATTTGKNFALQPLATGTGTITGTITDPANGLPIGGIGIEVYMQSGTGFTFFGSTSTNVAGTWGGTIPVGSYRVATTGLHPYRNEAYDNFPCLGSPCSTTIVFGSTPVAITAGGTTTVNFGLSAGDGISGTVTDAATGAPLAGISVNLFQVGSAQFAGSVTTNFRGQFFMRGLPNGDYVAYTSNSLGYFDEIHNNIRCTFSCSPSTALSSGARITISGAAADAGADLAELVTGVNFALDARTQAPNAPSNLRIVTTSGTGVFTWTAPSLFNGGAPASYLLEAGGSPGTTFITLPVPLGTSFTVPGVPPGTYYVRIKAVNAHGASAASNEVRLVVGAGGTGLPDAPTGLTAFMAGDRITITWTAALGGGPASGYVVEAGSSSGASNIASLNVPGRSFVFSPVPNGFYFLRVRARNAAGVSLPSTEIMVVVGNVPAPPSSPSLGHSVNGSTVTLSWTAPAFGPVTSYVVEAGSAPGLSNLAVVNVGNVLTQSFAGVPPGTYFVRVRAVNAQGASVVSNERTIIVIP